MGVNSSCVFDSRFSLESLVCLSVGINQIFIGFESLFISWFYIWWKRGVQLSS